VLTTKPLTLYNYFRDYDPAVGGYVESDPLGIAAGLSTYSYVDSAPATFVDPMGLAKCVYSIHKHIMECTSNDGSETHKVGPGGVWSGQSRCQDNPNKECYETENAGPVPPGQYKMNHDTRPNHEKRWRLEPQPTTPGWKCRLGIVRCGFMFHPGRNSLGCITVDIEDRDLMERYDVLHNLLLQEDGSNTLKVVE
jgi:uncharacterized protein RhaS with RHS repeats